MRFLFCNYEYPPIGGGEGTISRFLAQETVRLGHEVEVNTAAFRRLPRDFRSGQYRIRRVRCLRRQAGQSNPLEMLSWVASSTPSCLLETRTRPDAIVSFHSIPSGMTGHVLSKAWGRPHLICFGGGDVPGWLPGELKLMHTLSLPLNRRIVYHAAHALANSDGLRDLAQKAFPKRQIGLLFNSVDSRVYCPPPGGRAGRTGPLRLFFAGRLTTQKGLDVLLRALARAATPRDGWVLEVAGTGPRLEEFKALAAELGLADRVTFHGFMGRDAVRDGYQRADVFTFPSRYEGMPCAVLEAMAAGLPILGTRIMGTEQLVEEGRNGLLVESEDVDALARAFDTMASDRAGLLRMGEESRRLALGNWTWQARALELAGLAREAIEVYRREGWWKD